MENRQFKLGDRVVLSGCINHRYPEHGYRHMGGKGTVIKVGSIDLEIHLDKGNTVWWDKEMVQKVQF